MAAINAVWQNMTGAEPQELIDACIGTTRASTEMAYEFVLACYPQGVGLTGEARAG